MVAGRLGFRWNYSFKERGREEAHPQNPKTQKTARKRPAPLPNSPKSLGFLGFGFGGLSILGTPGTGTQTQNPKNPKVLTKTPQTQNPKIPKVLTKGQPPSLFPQNLWVFWVLGLGGSRFWEHQEPAPKPKTQKIQKF